MDFTDQLVAYAQAHGLMVVAVFLAGLLSPKIMPMIRAFAAKTPTKADDLFVSALEACLEKNGEKISSVTVAELDKILTTQQLVDLVKLRKARIARQKAAAAAKP